VAFVIDGAEWDFNGWPAEVVVRKIEALIACVWRARDRGEVVWIGDDFQTRTMLGNSDLWSLLSPDAPVALPPELGHELAAWLGSAPRYLDEAPWADWITESRIQVEQFPATDNIDQAWAHHHVRMGRPVACLSLNRAGPHETISNLGSATVHWVRDEQTNKQFWRDAIDVEGGNRAALERLAPHAFPNLCFYPHVWHGLGSFAGGFVAANLELRRYLSVLDDHGFWAFTFPPPAISLGEPPGTDLEASPSNQVVERRFRGLNLEMAPEKPNVHLDRVCRVAREIDMGGKTLYCEWHGKLEPHRNRVHVHPPCAQSNHKVVVAIFHEHLPLPG
jgi:hypothetical protein